MSRGILFLDNDKKYCKVIIQKLYDNNYDVDIAYSNTTVSEYLNFNNYDLLIISLMDDTVELLTSIKKIFPYTKIIVLIDEKNREDELTILNFGVNYYLPKQINFKVLLKYIETLLKKEVALTREIDSKYFLYDEFEQIEVNLISRSVYKNGYSKNLTTQEYILLTYLLKNKGRALSFDELLLRFKHQVIEKKILKLYIHNLRRKLNLHSLVTVRGYGYKWK